MPNNQTKPNQTQTTPVARGGMNRQRVETATAGSWKPAADDRPRDAERNRDKIEWANKHLPDEHEPFVVTAMAMLQLTEQSVSRNSVMARLESTGRTMEQMKAKGWV